MLIIQDNLNTLRWWLIIKNLNKIIISISLALSVLTGCSTEVVLTGNTLTDNKEDIGSKRIIKFKDNSVEPVIDSIIENPSSFINYLENKEEIETTIESISGDDCDSIVSFDDAEQDFVVLCTPTVEEQRNTELKSILLNSYINYTTQFTLDLEAKLINQEVLTGENNTLVLQYYTDNQIVLIQFKNSETIAFIDVFTLKDLTYLDTINHHDDNNIPLEFDDKVTQSIYDMLTSNSINYVNNACNCIIDQNLLLTLVDKHNRFNIIDCYKNDNTIIFIDEYNGKNMLIKCSLNNNILEQIEFYE